MRKRQEKLVRDNIPSYIEANGGESRHRIASQEELPGVTVQKLIEEATEVAGALGDRDKLIEELADLDEVRLSLMVNLGISEEEVAAARQRKFEERGGFNKGIILTHW